MGYSCPKQTQRGDNRVVHKRVGARSSFSPSRHFHLLKVGDDPKIGLFVCLNKCNCPFLSEIPY